MVEGVGSLWWLSTSVGSAWSWRWDGGAVVRVGGSVLFSWLGLTEFLNCGMKDSYSLG